MRKPIALLGIVAGMLLGIGLLAGCGQGGDGARTTVAVPATATDAATPGGDTPASAGPPAGDVPAVSSVPAEDYRMHEGSLGGDVFFESPTRNIFCRLGDSTVHAAGCAAKDAPVPPGAEKSCAGNELYPASSLSRGFLLYPDRAEPTCFNQGYLGAPDSKALPYNRSVSANGYTCTSRVEGVTCLTAAGAHGFFLSAQSARSW